MLYKKICNIAIMMASIFVFFTWTIINEIDFSQYGVNNIGKHIINFGVNFILAFGFFNMFVAFISKILLKAGCIKRLILGSSFIEGIWIGYYTISQKHYLCYMLIEQNVDQPTIVTGFSYSVEKSLKYTWCSSGEVSISRNTLLFPYILTPKGGKASYDGFINYTLHGKKRFKSPELISGRAFNLESCETLDTELKKSEGRSKHKPVNYERKDLIEEALNFYIAEWSSDATHATPPDNVPT